MYREAVPDLAAEFRTVEIREGLAAVDIQVIHYHMNGFGCWVLTGQVEGHLRELKSRTIRCGERKVSARFRFYRTEDIGCPATLVFVIASGLSSRFSRRGRTDIRMERDRFLVQAQHWLTGIRRLARTSPRHLPSFRCSLY